MIRNLPKALSRNTVLSHKIKGHIVNLNRRVLQHQENDTVNDTANAKNDTVTGLKESLQKVYMAILNNPEITHSEIMETLHIS